MNEDTRTEPFVFDCRRCRRRSSTRDLAIAQAAECWRCRRAGKMVRVIACVDCGAPAKTFIPEGVDGGDRCARCRRFAGRGEGDVRDGMPAVIRVVGGRGPIASLVKKEDDERTS